MRNSVRKLRKWWVLSNDLLKIMVAIATILMQNEIQQFVWCSILEPNHAAFVQTYPLGYQFEILKIRSNYCLIICRSCSPVKNCGILLLWSASFVFCNLFWQPKLNLNCKSFQKPSVVILYICHLSYISILTHLWSWYIPPSMKTPEICDFKVYWNTNTKIVSSKV